MSADVRLPPWSPQESELNETTMHLDTPFDLPPEAALDGPPDGGDLMLQRTLGRVRQEKAREGRRRQGLAVAVSTGLLAVALAGGVVIGRELTADPGGLVVSGVANGTGLTAVITPAEGWDREDGRGVELDGAALVAADDVRSVSVETVDGQVLVTALAR